jgi:hypothetical protein
MVTFCTQMVQQLKMSETEMGKKLGVLKKYISGEVMSNIKDCSKAMGSLRSLCHGFITKGNHFYVLY